MWKHRARCPHKLTAETAAHDEESAIRLFLSCAAFFYPSPATKKKPHPAKMWRGGHSRKGDSMNTSIVTPTTHKINLRTAAAAHRQPPEPGELDPPQPKRLYPVFVHSQVDDLHLTGDELIMLGHLARLATDGRATVGYDRLADFCFRPHHPRASDEALRKRAQRVVRKLEQRGLLLRQTKRRPGRKEFDASAYYLTPTDVLTLGCAVTPVTENDEFTHVEGVTNGCDKTPKNEAICPGSLSLDPLSSKNEEEEIPPTPQGLEDKPQPPPKAGGGEKPTASTQPAPELPREVTIAWIRAFGTAPTDLNEKCLRGCLKIATAADLVADIDAAGKAHSRKAIVAPGPYVKSCVQKRLHKQIDGRLPWSAPTPTAASLTPALPTEAATPTQTHATDIASTWAAILRGEPCGNAPGLDPTARQLLAGTSVTNGKWEGNRPILTVHGIFAANEREIRHILRTDVCNLWFEHCQQSAMWEVSPW